MAPNNQNASCRAGDLDQLKKTLTDMSYKDISETGSKLKVNNFQPANTHENLEPDRAQVELFLNLFPGLISIQIFGEGKNASNIRPKIFHGWNDKTFDDLCDYNKKGAGIFFMVNEGDGLGRKNENITKIRTVVVDLDGPPLQPVLDCGFSPHAIVQSSPGKFHAYWRVSDCELSQFERIQLAIADKFDGDDKIKDLCRVMRMPGFIHQKNEPYLSHIIDIKEDRPAYTLKQVIDGLGLDFAEPVKAKAGQAKSARFKVPERVGKGSRNDTMFRFICSNFSRGFTEQGNWAAAVAENDSKFDPPLSDEELKTIFYSAIKYRNNNLETGNVSYDYIEEFNKEYFVSQESGKTFVFHETFDTALEVRDLVKYTFANFKQLHDKDRIEVGTSTKGKGSAWLGSKDRRQYKGIMLAPPGMTCPEGYYNLWKGFGVEPVKGNWNLMQRHLYDVVCSDNINNFVYLMVWLATCVQVPSEPPEAALVLRGKKGIGKGILGNAMCKLFGNNSIHLTNARHLVGHFNSHLRSCILLFADESFYAGDRQHESVQKGLITEPTITIEQKGIDLIEVKNMLHIIMASNSDWVVPASIDERRYFVLDVSDKRRGDRNYFKQLVHELENGGLSAMLYDLLEYDLTNFDIRDIPQTNALLDQKIRSLDPLKSWWYQILKEGKLPEGEVYRNSIGDLVAVPCTYQGTWGMVSDDCPPQNTIPRVPTKVLYESYSKKVPRPLADSIFGQDLKKLLPGVNFKKRLHGPRNRQVKYYEFPDLDVCREYFSELINAKIDWEDEDV